jgi:hypothetical protein
MADYAQTQSEKGRGAATSREEGARPRTPNEGPSGGDSFPRDARIIEVRVAELRQLFDSLDPSPFQERDLDSKAAEYIVSWARELPRNARLALLVHLERTAGLPNEAILLRDAIDRFFRGRATAARLRLRQLFRVGRVSAAVGVGFLVTAFVVIQVVGAFMPNNGFRDLLRESFVIGGWVAMWRPLEIFLYDWWPIRAEARLFDRLGVMPVRIRYSSHGDANSWRHDWPAAHTSAAGEAQRTPERPGAT